MPEWLRYRDAASEKLNQIQKRPDKHVRAFFRRQISVLEFRKQETGMWKISSVWQEFDCKQEFEKEDIVSSLNKCFYLRGLERNLMCKHI